VTFRFSRWMWISIAGGVILILGGKLTLDMYFATSELVLTPSVPDELHDPRTTEELEALCFGILNDQKIQEQCETVLQESDWTLGVTLSEILAAGSGGQSAPVSEMFSAFRTRQVEQYDEKTTDPESVRATARELLKLWATLNIDSPDMKVVDRIGELAGEAIAAGSADVLIRMMAVRYGSQPITESVQQQLAELPDQLTAAGYSSQLRLLIQVYRFLERPPADMLNRKLVGREIIKDIVRYSEEFSSSKELDRVNWYYISNAAGLLDADERHLLYRRLMISEKTSPFILQMMAGLYYQDRAANRRGGGFASSVATDAWPSIEKDYTTASLHYRIAWILRPDIPHAAFQMTVISNVSPGDEHWSTRDWFELTCRAQFDFMPGYTAFLHAQLPRWGGSHQELLAFGKECAETKAFETSVPYALVRHIVQIGKETPNGTTWEDPSYVKILTDFWAAMDRWGTENNNDRTASQWKYQASVQVAVLIRNRRYAEARTILDAMKEPPLTVPMQDILRDPPLAVSSAYALADPEAAALVEIEKRFGAGIPADATEEEFDQAIKAVAAARANSSVLRAAMYLAARESSLTQQKKFLSGDWVDLQFDPQLDHWRIQDSVATVESPTSLRLSNLTLGDSAQLAIPRVAFPPPYELHVTLERIRGDEFLDRLGVNIGAMSQAVMFGEPGGITFVMDNEQGVIATYVPGGGTPQAYYVDGLENQATLRFQIWPGQYRCFYQDTLIPLLPVHEFLADSQLSLGSNPWEVDRGEIRISDVRVRKMGAPAPPAVDAPVEETIEYLSRVAELEPKNVLSRLLLADLLGQNKTLTDAMPHYEAVYQLDPSITRMHGALGMAYLENDREPEALELLLSSSKLRPMDPVLDGLAWLYATAKTDSLRDGQKALEMATEICDRTQNETWNYLATKAAALAELQRFPEAIEVMEKVIAVAPPDQHPLLQSILGEFQKNRPWRGKATE